MRSFKTSFRAWNYTKVDLVWLATGQLLQAVFLAVVLVCLPVPTKAGDEVECYSAIDAASRATGVPKNILLAIAKTETGRSVGGVVQPWPWAINIRGKGEWFGSEAALLERALEQISKGETSFDVGCFQLNYRWHGEAFANLDAMIAPKSNALYAARFLKSLHKEFADWNAAVGAYHSRNAKRAQVYKAKFATHYVEDTSPSFASAQTVMRERSRKNSFPLLKNSKGRTRLGSLVPRSIN